MNSQNQSAPTMPLLPMTLTPEHAAMALKSTIFKAQIQLADIDHGVYTDLAFTIARHPSETDERMMVRIAALALQAHAVSTDAAGDARVAFGAGLSDPDDPDVHVTDFSGRKRRWIEVGQPEERPLVRACSVADRVLVYAYAASAELWWRDLQRRVQRLERLQVWRLPADSVGQLAGMTQRSMQLQATVQDGVLSLSDAQTVVSVEPERWQ
jgi:uncharacterized protein YaeQ